MQPILLPSFYKYIYILWLVVHLKQSLWFSSLLRYYETMASAKRVRFFLPHNRVLSDASVIPARHTGEGYMPETTTSAEARQDSILSQYNITPIRGDSSSLEPNHLEQQTTRTTRYTPQSNDAASFLTSSQTQKNNTEDIRPVLIPKMEPRMEPKMEPYLVGVYNCISAFVTMSVTQIIYHLYVKHYFTH